MWRYHSVQNGKNYITMHPKIRNFEYFLSRKRLPQKERTPKELDTFMLG
jgi:hypothetical protein